MESASAAARSLLSSPKSAGRTTAAGPPPPKPADIAAYCAARSAMPPLRPAPPKPARAAVGSGVPRGVRMGWPASASESIMARSISSPPLAAASTAADLPSSR
jgi:hypothetical protein